MEISWKYPWKYRGNIMGNIVEIIMEISWTYHGNIMAISWKYRGNIMEISWKCHGHIMEISWKYRGNIMEICWKYHGNIMEISWNYHGHIMENHGNIMEHHEISMEISWKYNGNHGNIMENESMWVSKRLNSSKESLEVKLPTIWRDEKAVSREKSQKRKDQKKEDAGAQKGRKVAKTLCFFVVLWLRRVEKVGSLKRRVRRHLGRWEMKSCTALWREAHFEVKMLKTPGVRTTFGSCDVEKVHGVVAWSTFWSQNVQSTPGPDHFWKLRCRKSARRCGAKHISKWKCTKHYMFAPLLEVQMSKKCTPLWREAHFEVKMYKTLHVRATFGGSDVEKVHAVVARSTFRSQNVKNTRGSEHFWRLRCRKSARRCGVKMYKTLGVRTTFGGSDVASLQDTTLQNVTLHYTPVHYITLHYTPVHSTTLNLHYTTLHYTEWHCNTDRQVDS